jgi:molybdenum cofactor biosynthesis protein B
MSETLAPHKEHVPEKLVFAIYICSTSRYLQMERGEAISDLSGELIQNLIQASGHTVLYKKILLDDKTMIAQAFKNCLSVVDLDVIIFSGGTGVVSTDVTIEAVLPLLEKTLPGFGEFFRQKSFEEVSSAAVLSRAIAGVTAGKTFFCIPGSLNAVKTAVEKLILPEAPHIVRHARE